jgi:hypothetical protein
MAVEKADDSQNRRRGESSKFILENEKVKNRGGHLKNTFSKHTRKDCLEG